MRATFKIIPFLLLFSCNLVIAQQSAQIDSLKKNLLTAKEDTNKVKLLTQLSSGYYSINPTQGIEYGNQALALSEKLNWNKGKAFAFSSIGLNYCYGTSEYAKASEFYNKALPVFEELQLKTEISHTYNDLAVVYQNQGLFQRSVDYYLKSLKLCEELGNKKMTAVTLGNLGTVYDEIGNKSKAMECYNRSLVIFKEYGDKAGEARMLTNIGNIYRSQHNYTKGIEYNKKALILHDEIGSKKGAAYNYINISSNFMEQPDSVYVSMGLLPEERYAKTLEYSFKSLKLNRELNQLQGLAVTYYNIGYSYYQLVKKNAVSVINQQYKGNKQAVLNLAKCYIDSAILIDTKIENLYNLFPDYLTLSEIRSLSGDYLGALESHKKYVAIKDSVFNLENARKLTEMTMQYEFDKKEVMYQKETQIKDQRIALMNRENEMKSLQLTKQEAVLRHSRLEAEKNQTNILLLNTNHEVQKLTLTKTQKELAQQQAEAKAKAAELEVIQKDKQLKEQQLGKQAFLRNGILAGFTLLIAVVLLTFHGIQLKRKLEKQQAISHERKRISADLHDDIGAGLSKISLLSEMLKKNTTSDGVRSEAIKISRTSQELSENISEIIWALNTNNDYLENLIAYIRRYAGEYLENAGISLQVNVPKTIPVRPITGEQRRNIFYTMKEALHNMVKHAEATKAEISFTVDNSRLGVIISDNGKGIPEGELNRFGNGLHNMKSRMKSIQGDLTLENHNGTKITLILSV